jgi:hypothetical protein
LYTNIDIPEARKLIEKYSGEENVPKIIDMFRSMQGSIEEQMFYNRYTLHEITELRKDNIYNEVTYLFLFFPFTVFIYYILLVVGFPVHIKSNNR